MSLTPVINLRGRSTINIRRALTGRPGNTPEECGPGSAGLVTRCSPSWIEEKTDSVFVGFIFGFSLFGTATPLFPFVLSGYTSLCIPASLLLFCGEIKPGSDTKKPGLVCQSFTPHTQPTCHKYQVLEGRLHWTGVLRCNLPRHCESGMKGLISGALLLGDPIPPSGNLPTQHVLCE